MGSPAVGLQPNGKCFPSIATSPVLGFMFAGSITGTLGDDH